MRSRSVRMVIPAAVLAAAALALTGCSNHKSSDASGTSGSSPTGASTGTTAPATPTDTAAAPTDSPTATAPTPGGGSTTHAPAVHPAAGTACTSGQLSVSLRGQSVGAGQYYAQIVFTNKANSPCTLTGYPGVSYVKAAGAQSGNAAARTGAGYHTVTLPAHGSASATMHDANGMGGFSAGQCQLTTVEGLRVYPPNQKGALFLPDKTEHCAGSGIHSLTIGPVA